MIVHTSSGEVNSFFTSIDNRGSRAMDLQIFGRDSSYNVQKVLWLAAELQLPIEHIQLGGKYGGLDSPAFRSMNPMQKVPVLVDAGAAVWESNSILRYLLNQYARGPWRCTEPLAKSEYERWMDWELCKLEPAFYGVFWGYYRTPQAQRDTHAIQQAVIDCEQCLLVLAHQLDNKAFLLGERPTLADICAGVYLYRLAEIELPISFPKKIQCWYKRLQARPAYQQWVMRDFSELSGRLTY